MTALTDALQRVLAAEHEAVFGYGTLGPHLAAPEDSSARADQAAHELLRDAVQDELVTRGAQPVAPQPDYPALYPVDSPAQARALALRLETQAAVTWRASFAAAASARPVDAVTRDRAQDALTATALRAMRWRQAVGRGFPTVPFPGI